MIELCPFNGRKHYRKINIPVTSIFSMTPNVFETFLSQGHLTLYSIDTHFDASTTYSL